ncbi:hypothetical protein CQ14_30985 [Bradyrhizobium lablabi]|uniref:Uncharacterized protein n=1 Tax=Bradyrhizobium lablabi TaxID=722472 RepID=A0A0R3MRW9_9BRAD|nr:hypothetical protein [Bradyrhizobium lablabi]KRR22635.1 hypothetical protein CQ14_30985 [Bradyrhizobium lablabi]
MTIPGPTAPPPAPPQMPTNAADAATRLNELKSDAGWRDRYLGGGITEQREITALQEIINKGDNPDVDKAMAGLLDDAPVQRSGHMQMIGVAQMLREAGVRDEVIRETLTGKAVTQAEYDAVARLKAERLRDHAWTKEFLAGNGEHKRAMTLMNIVLSSPIKKEVAA